MIGDQKNKDDGYVNVSTKVPPHVAELLNIIAMSRGTDIYGLLQLFIKAIIRAAKATTDLSPDMKLLLEMLEMDSNWNNAFNFANPSARQDVAQMILILQQHDGKQPRKGFGLVMIDKPFMGGDARQTYCVDDILERVAEVAMAGLYKQLRQVGISLGSGSLCETLITMCDAQQIINFEETEREELPGLGEFHDFGKVIEWGKRTKQRKHRTPDSLANQQQRIIFDDFDRDSIKAEVQDLEGEVRGDSADTTDQGATIDDFRPFDQEY